MKNILHFLLLAVLAFLSLFPACSSKPVNENSPEELYADAQDDVERKRFLQAVEKFKNIKNKFPYSHFSTLSALRIADVYFLEESFAEAAASYENFQDLHPKHEKADYVAYRIGDSYFNQLPSTDDRDLSLAAKAIENFDALAKMYPQSSYLNEASQKKSICNQRLFNKERYIADYYFKQKQYLSSMKRYEKIVQKFDQTDQIEEIYYKWFLSAKESDQQDEAKHIKDLYKSRFPSGRYYEKLNE